MKNIFSSLETRQVYWNLSTIIYLWPIAIITQGFYCPPALLLGESCSELNSVYMDVYNE